MECLRKLCLIEGLQITLKFLERLHETLDNQLRFSSSCHPQTDGQTERVNQILKDMLRACALQYEGVGIKFGHTSSSPITTAIKRV
jgi:hypothetical protein